MARIAAIGRLALLAVASASLAKALAQTNGPTGQILSTSPASSTNAPTTTSASAGSGSTTASPSVDVPLSLWSGAVGLLSSYYPSSTPSNLATATWPDTVVLDSKTYSVHPATSPTGSATTSLLAEETSLPSTNKNHGGLSSDKKVGIAVGVAVAAVALVVLAVVLCCLHRRRRSTGAWFNRRPTPSVTDSDLESWRSPPQRYASTMSQIAPAAAWNEKYDSLARGPAAGPEPGGAFGALRPPPAVMHPAFARQYSNYSSSEDNPFFTPEERSQQYESAEEGAPTPRNEMAAIGAGTGSGRNSTDTLRHTSRPPTPFNPFLMMAGGAGARDSEEHHNPFASPEDDEDEERDLVSPIIPARSPERRHSPMIHYPSWNEISEFDFTGDGQRRQMRPQVSYDDSDDGWRPTRDSVHGRYELA